MLKIIPAILTSDKSELKDMLSQCEGRVDRVSVDIIDGVFADNKTIDPIALSEIQTDLEIDYQLMVKNPIQWVERCVQGKAKTIIGHVEMMGSQVEFVGRVMEAGLEVGLGLDLDTPIENLDLGLLNRLDTVLLMSVKAGFGGQEFREEVIEKIKLLRALREDKNFKFRICVDGGITEENIKSIVEASADEVCIGRRLFDGDLAGNINNYLKAVYE